MLVRAILILFCACLAATMPASAQLTRDAKALAAFAERLDEASTAPDFVGLAVIVIEDGRTALLRTYGERSEGSGEAVTPDTVFRVASVSKGFAGVLAALEARSGRLDLSTRIDRFVPAFQLRAASETAKVTVEHVLSHRVGLPPFAFDNLLEDGLPPSAIIAKFKSVKLVCRVGDCYGYQNTVFDMAATAIESVAGAPYGDLVETRLFEPLGMSTASVGLSGLARTGNWARPHVLKPEGWRPAEVREAYYRLPAAAGVNASITDMGRWLVALMGLRPDVLPADVLEDIQRARISTPAETRRQKALRLPVTTTAYGLGWRISDFAGERLVSHTGSVEGYIAHVAFLPERRAGIAVLSNTRGARAAKIVPMWLEHELGLPPTDWMQMDNLEPAGVFRAGFSAEP